MENYKTINSDILECPESMYYILEEFISPFFKDSYIKFGDYKIGETTGHLGTDKLYYQYFLMYEDYILFKYNKYNLKPYIQNLDKLYGEFWKGLFSDYNKEPVLNFHKWNFNMIYVLDINSDRFKNCLLIPEEKCKKVFSHKKEILDITLDVIDYKCFRESEKKYFNHYFATLRKDIASEIVIEYYKEYDTILSRSKILLIESLNVNNDKVIPLNYRHGVELLLGMFKDK